MVTRDHGFARQRPHAEREEYTGRGLLLFIQPLQKRQRLALQNSRAGNGRPAARQARAGFDAVHVDAADQAAFVGDGPAHGEGVALADAEAGEGGAGADHPLDEIDVALLVDDGDAGVALAAGLLALAGVVAGDLGDVVDRRRLHLFGDLVLVGFGLRPANVRNELI